MIVGTDIIPYLLFIILAPVSYTHLDVYKRQAVHYIYPLKRNDKGVTTNNIIERLSDGGPQQLSLIHIC